MLKSFMAISGTKVGERGITLTDFGYATRSNDRDGRHDEREALLGVLCGLERRFLERGPA